MDLIIGNGSVANGVGSSPHNGAANEDGHLPEDENLTKRV